MKKKTITGYIAVLTFILAAVALQLYFNKDHYFAMNRAKCSFTMIVLIGAVVTAIFRPIESIWTKQEKQKMILLDWCVLVFGCSSFITCLLSQEPEMALVGTKGMFVGAFTYLTGMLVYFVVSRNMIPNYWIVGILAAGWTLIFVWTIVNQCGTDIFGMHHNMRPGDERLYVSSMGNVNSASVAFASSVPFLVSFLALCSRDSCKYLLALAVFIGLFASLSIKSDGIFIGLLTMIPFVVIAVLSDIRKFDIALLLLIIVGLSVSLYHFLCICTIIKPGGVIYKLSGYWIGEIMTVVAVVMFYLHSHGILNIKDKSLKLIRTSLCWFFVAVLCGFVIFSIAKSFHDPNYANTRGAIWKGNLWTFRLYNPIEMIFGQGSGMFAKNATLAHTMLMGKETATVTFATSHDILLQALMSNGIIGLLCLLLGLYVLIRDWIRDLRPIVLRPMSKYESIRNVESCEVIRVASFTAIMGYFGASLVESTYPHTVMLLFAMLALYRSSYFVPRKKDMTATEDKK